MWVPARRGHLLVWGGTRSDKDASLVVSRQLVAAHTLSPVRSVYTRGAVTGSRCVRADEPAEGGRGSGVPVRHAPGGTGAPWTTGTITAVGSAPSSDVSAISPRSRRRPHVIKPAFSPGLSGVPHPHLPLPGETLSGFPSTSWATPLLCALQVHLPHGRHASCPRPPLPPTQRTPRGVPSLGLSSDLHTLTAQLFT